MTRRASHCWFLLSLTLILACLRNIWQTLLQSHRQIVMFVSTRIEEVEDYSDADDADVNNKNENIASCELWRISEDDGIRITEPLNKAARNEMARQHPAIASIAIANARSSLAKQAGFLKSDDFVVSWEAAFIPHHLRFTVRCSKGEVEHFASITNRATRDPVSTRIRTLRIKFDEILGEVCKRSHSARQFILGQATCQYQEQYFGCVLTSFLGTFSTTLPFRSAPNRGQQIIQSSHRRSENSTYHGARLLDHDSA